MVRVPGLVVAVAVGLAGSPAQAADPDWAVGAAAYQESKASGTKLTIDKQYGVCAAYWTAWSDKAAAEDVELPDAAIDALDSGVIGLDAQFSAKTWSDFANGAAESKDAFAQASPLARQQVAAALAGDSKALHDVMQVLGFCQSP